VHGSTTIDLEVRCTHLNHLKGNRGVDFAMSQVPKPSGSSIVIGKVAADLGVRRIVPRKICEEAGREYPRS
jgi:hypothetical protein